MSGGTLTTRSHAGVAAVFAASAAVTLAVTLSPRLQFAYRLPALHVAIETAAGIVGMVAAYLAAGRFRRRRRLDDLLLTIALALLAGTNLAFGTLPAALAHGPTPFSTWAAVAGRVLGALALALAAFAPARPSGCSPRLARAMVGVTLGAYAAAAIAIAVVGDGLPIGVETDLTPESSARPRLVGHPGVLGVQLAVMALYAVAALGFTLRFDRERDDLTRWLAVAAVLGAFSRLNYFLYPSLYTEWVYTGDAFRLLFYVVLLGAAAREMRSYWNAAARIAVMEERRRLARELHDGVAQELAFIARNLKRLDGDNATVERVQRGAARALAESRRAIAALAEPLDRPFDAVLAEVAQEVAAREGTRVALSLAHDPTLAPAQAEALVRIASEAITNAARHGAAELVRVQLEADGAVALRVIDAGRGFDPSRRPSGGFGLVSMRERAQAVGGRLRLSSSPGHGTVVEVTL